MILSLHTSYSSFNLWCNERCSCAFVCIAIYTTASFVIGSPCRCAWKAMFLTSCLLSMLSIMRITL